MNHYKLIFITTFIDLNLIGDLLDSVARGNNRVRLLVVVVAQKGLRVESMEYQSEWTDVRVVGVDGMVSLSKARNIGLGYIKDQNIVSDYVMFPDDDSTFSEDFFDNFQTLVHGNTLIDVYCRGTRELFKPNNYKQHQILTVKQYDAAMSVNMVIEYDTVQKVGPFDEKMGVGAPYGAGEDGDYFIRCCQVAENGFCYEKKMWNSHPKGRDKYRELTLAQLKQRYRNYGRGVIYLLRKHNLWMAAVKCCFAALAGAFVALVKFDFKLFIARVYAFFIRLNTLIKLKI